MSYRVTRKADGRPSIDLHDEPPHVIALEAAPPAREPELDTGQWLVMPFAAWSVPDIAAIQTALNAVEHFGGTLKLGLRPYDSSDEHGAWCPAIAGDDASPLWLLLDDGEVRMKRSGFLMTNELVAAINAARRT
jgi:hypothetical protein